MAERTEQYEMTDIRPPPDYNQGGLGNTTLTEPGYDPTLEDIPDDDTYQNPPRDGDVIEPEFDPNETVGGTFEFLGDDPVEEEESRRLGDQRNEIHREKPIKFFSKIQFGTKTHQIYSTMSG